MSFCEASLPPFISQLSFSPPPICSSSLCESVSHYHLFLSVFFSFPPSSLFILNDRDTALTKRTQRHFFLCHRVRKASSLVSKNWTVVVLPILQSVKIVATPILHGIRIVSKQMRRAGVWFAWTTATWSTDTVLTHGTLMIFRLSILFLFGKTRAWSSASTSASIKKPVHKSESFSQCSCSLCSIQYYILQYYILSYGILSSHSFSSHQVLLSCVWKLSQLCSSAHVHRLHHHEQSRFLQCWRLQHEQPLRCAVLVQHGVQRHVPTQTKVSQHAGCKRSSRSKFYWFQ